MENLKIKVNSEAESKEAQRLFSELGYEMGTCSIGFYPAVIITTKAWGTENWCSTRAIGLNNPTHENHKEITLQELRDMVVLKRNDPKDATHESDVDDCDDLYFVDSSKNLYRWFCGSHWAPAVSYKGLLKPIKEETMKEYLFKYNDQYTLVELLKEDAESNPEQYIEVPEWGNYAYNNDTGVYFLKDAARYGQSSLVWQRESLNDKIATAEVARQNEKHSHYKKDVSHLNVIDPYRIADLYDLHPCADHIMKKSLCAGNRGHKDMLRDIQDIIDTAERWKQMIEEDGNEI